MLERELTGTGDSESLLVPLSAQKSGFHASDLDGVGKAAACPPASANKGSVEEMERQVLLLREKIHYLQVIAMRPGHSAEDLERLRWLERAARAQVKRRAQRSRS